MFEKKTYQALLSEMLSQIPNSTDKREGAMIYDALAPCAYRLAEAYLAMEDVAKNLFPATAQRSYLAAIGANYDVPLKEAQPAILELTVTPSTCTVPLGHFFRVNAFSYRVTENRGGGVYAMTAVRGGSDTNITTGNAVPTSYINGLTGAAVTGILSAGTDDEDTEVYRARVLNAMKNVRFGGNKADYVAWALQQDGIAHARVYPAWVSGNDIILEVLGDGYTFPDEPTIARLQAAVCATESAGKGESFAPIGHRVTVQRGLPELVNLIVSITYETGTDHATVRSAVRAEITRLINATHKQWDETYTSTIRQSELSAAIGRVPGVAGVTALNINNGVAVVQSTDVLIPGEVDFLDI